MDKRISKSRGKKRRMVYAAIVALSVVVIFGVYAFTYTSTIEIDTKELMFAEVTSANFTSAISVQGTISAKDFIVIDAKQSGSVKEIFIEAGETVKQGDTILILENSNLELEVLQRESQLLEQLNNQRQTKILLNQNNLNQKQELEQINYQIGIQKPRYERNKRLYEKGVIALQEYEEISKTYFYFLNRRDLFREAYTADSMARRIELNQILLSEKRILQNLEAVKAILNRLVIIANQNGRLGDFEIQVGQTINEGDRVGEIYNLDNPIISAQVDELYINTIQKGLPGTTTINGKDFDIEIDRIIPSITSGSFEIEVAFKNKRPENLRIGQTARVQLFLSESKNSIVIPIGQFYNSTGGNWVFKIVNDEAIKTDIQLGDKNATYHEVLAGLSVGEQIIVSNYDRFKKYDKIKIK